MQNVNTPTAAAEQEGENSSFGYIRSHRWRRNLGTGVCALVALAAVGVAVVIAFGGPEGSAPPAAGLQPGVSTQVQDPIVTRYGQQPEWMRCMKLHEPLVMRYGRCAQQAAPDTTAPHS